MTYPYGSISLTVNQQFNWYQKGLWDREKLTHKIKLGQRALESLNLNPSTILCQVVEIANKNRNA